MWNYIRGSMEQTRVEFSDKFCFMATVISAEYYNSVWITVNQMRLCECVSILESPILAHRKLNVDLVKPPILRNFPLLAISRKNAFVQCSWDGLKWYHRLIGVHLDHPVVLIYPVNRDEFDVYAHIVYFLPSWKYDVQSTYQAVDLMQSFYEIIIG